MRIETFDYHLPPALIAQEPCAERDRSRLLVLRRETSSLDHREFLDLPKLLAPGDLLVLNDTRVLPARLVGRRERTGGRWEGLFLRQHPDGAWELLCQTRGRLVEGETIEVEPGPFRLTLKGKTTEGRWLALPGEPAARAGIRTPRAEACDYSICDYGSAEAAAIALLERFGQVPLPPYIRKGRAVAADRERYQTLYARRPGAVAAPTAGLHFTPRLFDLLGERAIDRAFVTLHVGLGTFQPIQVENIAEHAMHREWAELPAATVAAINACRARGGRVVAVGTTTARVLETVAATGALQPWSGETKLFIYPPYPFKAVDALITNFHLPRSSLLLLVSAFAGIDLIRQSYKTAVEQAYRFYSYGDAMLIV